MIDKWNASELKNNSAEFSKVICNEFFSYKEKIEGTEIINLTEIKQLNLFILKSIFDKWKTETENLRSPYFDYSHPEVNKAFEEFMNILSRHISISKAHFGGLVEKSLADTVSLYQSPRDFFLEQMRNLPEFKLTQEWLQTNGKFFYDYNWVLRELSAKLSGVQFVYANEANEWIQEILPDSKVENHESEIKDIKKIIGITEHQTEGKNPYQSFFDSIEEYKQTKKTTEAPEALNIESVRAEEPNIIKEVVEVPAEAPKLEIKQEPALQTQAKPVIPSYSVSEEKNSTINDVMHNSTDSESLGDLYQKKKIENIRGNISLNQKFLFINNLFGGNSQIFNQAIDELEVCGSFQEAKDQMLKKYMPQFKWNLNNPETEEFLDLLKRRYN